MRVGAVLRRWPRACFGFVWIAIVLVSAFALNDSQQQGRERLDSRFRGRADQTARFVEIYTADLQEQELRTAARELTGSSVSSIDLGRVVILLDAEAAVLLDDRGAVLRIVPDAPALRGKVLTTDYPHLRRAVSGSPGVSGVVPSVVERVPVVAFAVPYETPSGRRVFSAAFDIESVPLAAYLQRAAALPPNRAYLVDPKGTVIAGSGSGTFGGRPLGEVDPELAGAARRGPGAERGPGHHYVVTSAVVGTPWRVVMTAPEANLYQSIQGPRRWIPWGLWLGFAIGGLISVLLVGRLITGRHALADANDRLHRLARIDTLTGLPNRRSLQETLAATVKAAERHRHELSVLSLDIDRFKAINDTYGHDVGDIALLAVATSLKAIVRGSDTIGRWGGEEFLVVLPAAGPDEAREVAERLRVCVAAADVEGHGEPVPLTVSVGGATLRGDETIDELVRRADLALYEAKQAGRDCVVVDAAAGAVPV